MDKLYCDNCGAAVHVPSDRSIVEVDKCPVCHERELYLED